MQPEGPAASDSSFDVEGYASNYSSHARIDRLLFIAAVSRDASVIQEAFRLAHDDVKQAGNLTVYKQLMERANGRLGPVDEEWVAAAEERIALRTKKFEADVAAAKSNMVKEATRMVHTDMGDFFYQAGDLQNAFKSYVRMRDYCATSKQIIAMCLAVIKVGFEINNIVHVNNYIQKAEQTPNIADDAVATAKLRVASGLSFLKGKKYKIAAQKFTEVSADLGQQYNEVLAAADVATYGALAGLASFSRAEMRSKIIDNIAFREYLELVPEVREMVHAFYGSSYATCLSLLEALRPMLALDLHLQPHLEGLHSAIRSKAIIQYTTPFTSVELPTMATAFATTVPELQKELEVLIVGGRIAARIDSHGGALYARTTDQRTATFHFALQAGGDYLRNTKALLLRANLQKHDFSQRSQAPRPSRASLLTQERLG